MMYGFSKYHGAGNDFLLADNRDGHLSLSPTMIRHLCDRHVGFGADGVMPRGRGPLWREQYGNDAGGPAEGNYILFSIPIHVTEKGHSGCFRADRCIVIRPLDGILQRVAS